MPQLCADAYLFIQSQANVEPVVDPLNNGAIDNESNRKPQHRQNHKRAFQIIKPAFLIQSLNESICIILPEIEDITFG